MSLKSYRKKSGKALNLHFGLLHYEGVIVLKAKPRIACDKVSIYMKLPDFKNTLETLELAIYLSNLSTPKPLNLCPQSILENEIWLQIDLCLAFITIHTLIFGKYFRNSRFYQFLTDRQSFPI